ncbi:unnamed protein product, partial [Staurois parvus]
CPVVGCRLLPEPLLRGRLPSVARGPCPVAGCRLFAPGPCPVVGCRLLPEPLLRGRLPSVARGPCPKVAVCCLPLPRVSNPLSSHGGSPAEAPS